MGPLAGAPAGSTAGAAAPPPGGGGQAASSTSGATAGHGSNPGGPSEPMAGASGGGGAGEPMAGGGAGIDAGAPDEPVDGPRLPWCISSASQVVIVGDSYINWGTHTLPADLARCAG
jgi:hypothetical protein